MKILLFIFGVSIIIGLPTFFILRWILKKIIRVDKTRKITTWVGTLILTPLFCFGIAILTFFVSGIFGDESHNTRHLIKNFNLGWYSEARNQKLFESIDHEEYGGGIIIAETVFEVGYDENFIIAKQHPNNDDTISWNNTNEHETWELDSVPTDTLGDQHRYVKINGKWLGISNGRNMHHDLFPDRKITYYYIVDIRNYELGKWKSKNNVFKLYSKKEFESKRQELGVPEKLDFTIIDEFI